MAWCLANPIITAVILGPRTMEQIDDNLAALSVKITPEEDIVNRSSLPASTAARDSTTRCIP